MELKKFEDTRVLIHMFSTIVHIHVSIRSTNPKPTPPFRQFSFGRNHLFHPPFLVREKQARLVTREAARDVIARTGRSTVKAPSACFAFLHSRGVSFARRFLRMNKPGLHPPAAARHPLPAAQSSLPAGKLLVCPPTSLFSHLPPGSSSSSSSMQAKLHHHHPSFNYGVVQTPPSPCYCEWKPSASLSFLRTVIWTGKLTGDFWFFQELIRVIVEYWIENGRDVFKFLKKSNYSCFFIFLFRLKKQD